MAISVMETYGARLSGERTPSEREKRFKVRGTDDEDAAYAALSAFVYTNCPRLGRLIVKSVSLDEGVSGASLWEGTATYGKRDRQTLRGEQPVVSFSTKGGTANVTRSLRTVQAVAAPVPTCQIRWVSPDGAATEWVDVGKEKTTPEREQWYAELDFRREERVKTEEYRDAQGNIRTRVVTRPGQPINFHHGINFENGSFKGCEKVVPALSCLVDLSVPDERLNPHYQRLLLNMTGTVNSKPFLGFRAGEWLFLGADINCRYEDGGNEDVAVEQASKYWDISYEFRGSPNVTNQYLGGLGPFSKRGHDYVWAYSEKRESTADDASASPTSVPGEPDAEIPASPSFSDEKMTVVAPLSVYVEQMYPYTDFAALGLPF